MFRVKVAAKDVSPDNKRDYNEEQEYIHCDKKLTRNHTFPRRGQSIRRLQRHTASSTVRPSKLADSSKWLDFVYTMGRTTYGRRMDRLWQPTLNGGQQ